MGTKMQVPVRPDYTPRQGHGRVFTAYFAIEGEVSRRIPENRQFIAVVRYFPRFVKRERYRWLPDLGPSKALLTRAKTERMPFEEYAQLYLKEIAGNPEALRLVEDIVDHITGANLDVVLFCYEKEAAKCHRTLLREMIANLCASSIGEHAGVFDGGEIS